MSNSIIRDMDTAMALVEIETGMDRAFAYAEYIEANDVTPDTVGKHVAALVAITYPNGTKGLTDDQKMARKYLSNNYRNGLNYQLGVGSKHKGKSDKYVTAEGLKAESWEAFVEKARAEWDAANNK